MSWDSYLDNLVEQSKDAGGVAHIDKCCIIGLDGGAAWTSATHPKGLSLSGTEGATLARCIKNNNEDHSLEANGIVCGSQKYMFLRQNGNMYLGKKKDHGAISIQKTKQAIVIAHCAEGKQQGTANKAVARVADYLEELGY